MEMKRTVKAILSNNKVTGELSLPGRKTYYIKL